MKIFLGYWKYKVQHHLQILFTHTSGITALTLFPSSNVTFLSFLHYQSFVCIKLNKLVTHKQHNFVCRCWDCDLDSETTLRGEFSVVISRISRFDMNAIIFIFHRACQVICAIFAISDPFFKSQTLLPLPPKFFWNVNEKRKKQHTNYWVVTKISTISSRVWVW